MKEYQHLLPLSVVVPIRDEAESVGDLHRRLRRALPAGTEIILVDDGSRDASALELARIAREDPGVTALGFLRPFGKSQALAAGFSRCRGEVIATIDADLQEDPAEILRLASYLRPGAPGEVPPEGAGGPRRVPGAGLDLVTGWRRRRRDPLLKVLGSRLFNFLVRRLSGVPLRDVNCGLKVMRREVIADMPLEGGFHRFMPLLAHWKGYRVGEVEVPHAPRRHGRSRFGKERIVHGLVDLTVLLFLEHFERRPSRLFISTGALLFAGGFAVSAYLALKRLITGSIGGQYPLLTLGVLLLVVGVQLVSMGFLGELVARQYRRGQGGEPRAFDIAPRPLAEGAGGLRAARGAGGGGVGGEEEPVPLDLSRGGGDGRG